jgi:Leucine-rich repeat (LRR) protein
MDKLELLWLEDNHFDHFPPVLTRLRSLKTLRLSGNRIPAIPDDIANLSLLEVLAVDNNALTCLPPCLGELTNLTVLQVRGNQIAALPEALSALASLRLLHMSTNALTEIPAFVCGLEALEEIMANGNRIAAVPAALADLPHLRLVNLSNNEICELPETLLAHWGLGLDGMPYAEGQDGGGAAAAARGDKPSVEVSLLGNPLLAQGGEEGEEGGEGEEMGERAGAGGGQRGDVVATDAISMDDGVELLLSSKRGSSNAAEDGADVTGAKKRNRLGAGAPGGPGPSAGQENVA